MVYIKLTKENRDKGSEPVVGLEYRSRREQTIDVR